MDAATVDLCEISGDIGVRIRKGGTIVPCASCGFQRDDRVLDPRVRESVTPETFLLSITTIEIGCLSISMITTCAKSYFSNSEGKRGHSP